MCKPKILEHNKHGFVARCNQCGNLQLAFGTAAITLDEEQFNEFRETLHDYHLAHAYIEFEEQKAIYVPTVVPSISLVFSLKELQMFIDMLEQAHLSLEIEKVLA